MNFFFQVRPKTERVPSSSVLSLDTWSTLVKTEPSSEPKSDDSARSDSSGSISRVVKGALISEADDFNAFQLNTDDQHTSGNVKVGVVFMPYDRIF